MNIKRARNSLSLQLKSKASWDRMLSRTFFMRHGRTSLNEQGLLQGSTDVSLSQRGRAEQELLAHEAINKKLHIDVIVSSTMKRATESATIFASALHIPAEKMKVNSHLTEYNMGTFEGKTITSLALRDDHANWIATPFSVSEEIPAGAEPMTVFVSRVYEGIQPVFEASEQDKTVLVVSHAMVLRAIRYLGLLAAENGTKVSEEDLIRNESNFFYYNQQREFIKIPHRIFQFTRENLELHLI